jgi:hypothetical protein
MRDRIVLFVLVLGMIGGVALAGCMGGDDQEPIEVRLLDHDQTASLGLYHCQPGQDYQAQGFSENPGQVPLQPGQGDEVETFWVQILSPQEDARCEQIEVAQLVFVSAIRFDSEDSAQRILFEQDPCVSAESTILHAGQDAVGAEGNATLVQEIHVMLQQENPDLDDPCA